MKDLDQWRLKQIALSSPIANIAGVPHVAVPVELLRRVTADFDVDHVPDELYRNGGRCR